MNLSDGAERETSRSISVLHVLPTLERRGAQMFARDLAAGLRTHGGINQQVAVLDAGADAVGMTRVLPDVHWFAASTGMGKVLELRRLYARMRPDVVLAYGSRPLKSAILARGYFRAPRVVYRKIGLTERWLGPLRWVKLPFQRWLVRRADAISAVGEAMKDEIASLLQARPDKVRVIYRGVDSSRFDLPVGTRDKVRATLGIAPEALVLTAVGALSWEKNVDAVLRVLASVRGQLPDACLLLVGEGPERARLEALSVELGLTEATRFLGQRTDVPELMAAADVLLLTSVTEGVPGVLIEAGMAGLPCVAWDVGGVREVLRDNLLGSVTPFGDEEAVASAAVTLLQEADRSSDAAAMRRARCMERFSTKTSSEQHIRLFADLLEGSFK